MICQLCLEDKTLLKKSHIIPNFLYKGLFDDKHKIVNVNLNSFEDSTFHQTGFKDKDILCADCDNVVIGKHERYASNTIFGKHDNLDIELYEGDAVVLPYVRFKNMDYTSIKLFFLSILWKSHISKNPFFDQVDLGSKYSEQIRTMILNNDAGPEDKFEVLLVRPETNGTRPTKSMIAPRRVKLDGNTAYLFHINEIMYHFNVSNHNKMSIFKTGIIKRDGIIDIAIAKNEWGTGYFDSFVGQIIPVNSRK